MTISEDQLNPIHLPAVATVTHARVEAKAVSFMETSA
jgi:hypothetical protein